MKLKELREILASEPDANGDLEIQVWLPGSRISLHSRGTLIRKGDTLLIEGNVEPGSALLDSDDG